MQTFPSGPPPTPPVAADVLQTLLAVSLTGVILFRPVYDPAAPAELIDLAYVQLNPAAQRVHPQTAALLGHRPLLGRRRREALPELVEARHQPFDQAYRTGQPVRQMEVPARVALPGGTGELTDAYYDITYQPLFDAAGQVEGVMSVSVEVTERVLVRRQAEAL